MTLLSALAGDAEIAALLSDAAQLDAMLTIERALAAASADAGWISIDDATAIDSAIEGFEPDWVGLQAGMVQDGVVVPALVRQLKAKVPEAHRAALHKGATSQDVTDTALMLQLGKVFDLYEARLSGLITQLESLDAAYGDRSLMAHTRMQVALPTTWRAKLASWSEPLVRHLRAIVAMRRSLLVIQLGGPVGDRGSFGEFGDAIAGGLARRLDLGLATPWQATRDPIIALGGLLAQISGSLGKLGMDVTLQAQNEVAAIRLEGGGGSSAMAHKSNPVNAEVLVALARYNAGLSGVLAQALVHENERSGAAWTLEWLTLPPMLEASGASLRLAALLLEQIRVVDPD
ncbi:3-carboxy-cis,cis-muconate cycloisomerase [Devosia sp. XJ19-1]|uniref:3-carboxy-cis,cis-muconate cycloisomerase n=1 Tax=Devosia ureilytica TaxID=2952754 RepID=A0A9Q4FUV6_9HYPH|nr:3-carboxy-cis,cis-muconate cycloisomerase [Devosia ureilytica]MCP8885143.1 3-carboxy-cis,cis-muconate cycloisomerase [Devosia ureilytica]MCP8888865.1 3-carboxy-cis,cis-muconate cycloisomerase [Devosia ureilytica]